MNATKTRRPKVIFLAIFLGDFAAIKILDFQFGSVSCCNRIAYNKVKTQAANSPPTTGPITGIHE